jgi:ribosomal protein S18 acetylase RimI-like enzyme
MIEVSQNNLAAINLYKNLGFKIINTRLNYYDNQAHALVMRYQALLKFKNKD